jgi:DNA-binding winged helix-turn-helix (wHTH) protein
MNEGNIWMINNNQNLPMIFAQDGPLNGKNWVAKNGLTIGRDLDCDISIVDRQVSRVHAKIEFHEGNKLSIIDLDSKNGTYVNGDRLESPHPLEDGDVIKIALIQEIVYMSSDATLPLTLIIPQESKTSQKLFIDTKARRVWIGDKELIPTLSVSQYKLLLCLYHLNNHVVHRDTIVQEVWGEKEAIGVTEQAIDALVRRLRNRLKKLDPIHEYIETIRGVGFLFKNDIFIP